MLDVHFGPAAAAAPCRAGRSVAVVASRTAIHVEALPARGLRSYVTAYVGFELRGFPAGVHLGTPSGDLTVVISLDEPMELAGSGRFETMVGGLTSRSVAIRHDGTQYGVQLALTPLGARAILGVPAAALAEEVVALDELLGPIGGELVDRLRGAATWPARFRVLDAVLAQRVSAASAPGHGLRPEVAEAWRRLVASRGQVQVGALSAALGWSRRHLGDRFRSEIGLTPKVAARVLRFEHAHQLATTVDPPSWADVATVAGYADQAHLVRDWQAFTGRSPTAWRRGEVLLPLGSG